MFRYGPFVGGWPWVGLAGTLLFWLAVIVLIVLLVRYLSRGGRQMPGPGHRTWHAPPPPPYPPPGVPTPEHILAERFARGEIDEEEFRQRLTTLRGAAYPGPPPGPPPPPAS